MITDFNEIIERRNTDSTKYNMKASGKSEDTLPFWVADMDFRAPKPVLNAIHERTEHGIFGYGTPTDAYRHAVCDWFGTHFQFGAQPEWIVTTPGVVFALSAAIRAFTKEGDAIIINRPVYYPFSNLINGLSRKLINSPLKENNGHYTIDFDDFEKKIVENDVRMYILCSPHNPVGRVWTADELRKAGEICIKHGVLVVSDEIHCDFVWCDHPHTMFGTLGDDFLSNCVMCTAPSKSFNLAGLSLSNIFIANPELRKKYRACLAATGASSPNVLGMAACRAAYEEGLEWLNEARGYIRANIEYIRDFTAENIPQVRVAMPEGTYLVWMDMRAFGLSADELESFIADDARLWLDGGAMFGPEGAGFQRINAACPRALLTAAMKNLQKAAQQRF